MGNIGITSGRQGIEGLERGQRFTRAAIEFNASWDLNN